ncbi:MULTISPECIES: hypothetical protein [unclassified Oceanispirochaeta]|uniref:hypothetical protein n=1 Tax=unclassified Oceanispirochaeta TaxID=2635722 RepID=UPI000E097C4C|nr:MULTISPECIES: hypothetical protein [unclassified Oceanispirochaeta]MBF9018585.1 hypothetical protein [Oceanispirochaeta sp. M2]NPD75008.1 hypothetical protein [Oceanispirochaeta sp. M1]RDG29129.1 hypothetical protein DV872_23210 [Oceanispirochaeta sp. M1]
MSGNEEELFNPLDRVYMDRSIQEAYSFLNRKDRESSPYLPSGFHGINREVLTPVTRGIINYENLSCSDYYNNFDRALDSLNCLALNFKFDLNKTRLLMAVVREAVKSKADPELCLSYLSLYRKVLEGTPAQVRNILIQKFHLTVLADRPLNTQESGFDDRVYGSFSLGKRTALQVVVDAYIKGLSRVTIVHINEIHRQIIPVVLEAGRMLDVDVEFALEFSHGRGEGKNNFLLYFPDCRTSAEYDTVLDSDVMSSFQNDLSKVAEAREKGVSKEIRRFNQKVRPGLNKGFEKYPELVMPRISLEDLLKTIKLNQLSIPSLGHYLYELYGNVLKKRMEAFDLDEFTPILGKLKKMKNREISALVEKVERLDQEYNKMDHEAFTARYLSEDFEISVAIPGFADHLKFLRKAGIDVILALPQRVGLPRLLESLLRYSGGVNGVELFNTKYFFSHREKEGEIGELIELINIYNDGAVKALFRKAQNYGLVRDRGDRFKVMLSDAAMQLLDDEDPSFRIKLGSGSNDYSIASPGMGFLVPRLSLLGIRSSLSGLAGHYSLPFKLGESLEHLSCPVERTGPISVLKRLSQGSVLLLGNPTAIDLKRKKDKKISFLSRMKSANSTIRNSILVILGILLALLPVKGSLAPHFITLWFIISIFQSVLSDLLSHGGSKIHSYRRELINGKDLSAYLFFTGLAIPVLGTASLYITIFLEGKGLRDGISTMILFILLGLVSWLYTGITTLLRGYKPVTALVNGARSFYSFPLAALSALVLPLPPIVQQKIWTAVAGAVVEGFAKYREDLRLRKSDFARLFHEISSPRTSERRVLCLIYDLLYIRGRMPRGKEVLTDIIGSASVDDLSLLVDQLQRDDLFFTLQQEGLNSSYAEMKPLLEEERKELIRELSSLPNS